MNYSPGQDGLTNVCVKPLIEPENIIIILESSMAFGLVLLFFLSVFFLFCEISTLHQSGFARGFLTMLK